VQVHSAGARVLEQGGPWAFFGGGGHIIIITDLYSAFRFKDTQALDAAQED